VNEVIVQVVRLIERVTGSLLGGVAVSIQAGNIILCIMCLVLAIPGLMRA
jgi:hypothetical protein